MAFALLPAAAMADDGTFTRNGITYFLLDNQAGVKSLDESLSGKVTIPEKVSYKGKSYEVTIVGYSSFGISGITNSSTITSVVLPRTVATYGRGDRHDLYRNNPLYDCSALKEIVVDKENPRYKSVDGALYSMNMDTLYAFPAGKDITSFTIPSSVSYI